MTYSLNMPLAIGNLSRNIDPNFSKRNLKIDKIVLN